MGDERLGAGLELELLVELRCINTAMVGGLGGVGVMR